MATERGWNFVTIGIAVIVGLVILYVVASVTGALTFSSTLDEMFGREDRTAGPNPFAMVLLVIGGIGVLAYLVLSRLKD